MFVAKWAIYGFSNFFKFVLSIYLTLRYYLFIEGTKS